MLRRTFVRRYVRFVRLSVVLVAFSDNTLLHATAAKVTTEGRNSACNIPRWKRRRGSPHAQLLFEARVRLAPTCIGKAGLKLTERKAQLLAHVRSCAPRAETVAIA